MINETRTGNLRPLPEECAKNKFKYDRQSIRLLDYDYAQEGAYFITLCIQDKKCLLGKIVDGTMRLNRYGQIVDEEWFKTAEIRPEIELGDYVIMPNHFHGIIHIAKRRGDPPVALNKSRKGDRRVAPTGPKPGSIGAIIAGFKSASSKKINVLRNTPNLRVWQRNYYEHVIRNDKDHCQIIEYITNNPQQWAEDSLYPDNLL